MKWRRQDHANPNWKRRPVDAPAHLAAEICVAEVEGDFARLTWLLAEEAERRIAA